MRENERQYDAGAVIHDRGIGIVAVPRLIHPVDQSSAVLALRVA